jgi:type VI secretion system protein ImpM
MSSVDKVGRTFPLTLAARLPGAPHLATALFDSASWFARLEEVALAALRVDADIHSLDQALSDLHFPDGERGLPYPAGCTATQSLAQSREVPLQMNDASDFARVLTIAATEAFPATPGWHTYWWSHGRSDGHAAAMTLSGLPDARTFATMLSI